MKKEFKYINLAEFKALDEGPGGYKGYPTSWDEIDEGGDLIPRGAYADTIEDFLQKGFNAHSHDWSFEGVIGYPTVAREDDQGFYIESQFHSTADAQCVRTKAAERLAAGKQVGLSIGFSPAAAPVYVYPKQYADELPKYVSPEAVDRVLERAAKFTRVRVLPKIELFEVSVVTAPMLRAAQMTEVKSLEGQPEISVKGMFEERLEERTNSLHNLYETLCYVIYQIQYMASSAERVGAELDAGALLDEALAEFTARVRLAVLSKLQAGESMDAYYYYGRSGAQAKIDKFLSVKSTLVSDVKLDEHSETVVSAVKEFAQIGAELTDGLAALVKRGKDKQEFRASTKEGRTISQATATRMSECVTQIESAATAMGAVKDDLSALVEMANPKEKADPAQARSLRTHSLRLQSRALGVAV